MKKLEYAIKLADKGFNIFPLIKNTKIPAIKDFAHQATRDKEQLTKWWREDPEYNPGISTENLMVIDVDTKNPEKNGIETMERLNKEGKYFPPTLTQITPTGGLHLIYNTPHPIKNSAGKIGPGIDTRGKGGYIVGGGSTLDGKPYRMGKGVQSDPSPWLLNACDAAREQIPQKEKKVVTVNKERAKKQASDYLASQETTEGERNVSGYRIACHLKDLGLDNSEVFLTMMEEWKCEPALDLQELQAVVNSAFTYGTEAQGSASPEAIFEAPVDEAPGENHPIENINKEYAFVTAGGGHHILHETTDHKGNHKVDHLHEATFHKRLASRSHQLGDGRSAPLTQFWMKSELRRSYTGIVFAPEKKTDERFYNLWRGFSVTPLEPDEVPTKEMTNAVTLFKEHVLENICDGDIDHFRWVMGWFAHLVQKPWEKPDTALVLRGRKGVGKNALLECIGRFFPANYMVTSDKRYMTGNFNSRMENMLLFVLDEAFWSGDKEAEGKLKVLITDPTINIEHKGKEPYKIDSCLRVVVLGNEDWLVPASHDERRYAVFNVGDARIQDRKFFTAMMEGMKNGGDRMLFTELKNYDLSKVDVKAAPKTAGLLAQKENSLSPFEQWWFDNLSQGYIEGMSDFDAGSWINSLDKTQFRNVFAFYASKRQMKSWLPSDAVLIDRMRKFIPDVAIAVSASTRLLQFIVPSLEKCREGWDNYQGQKTNWRK